MPATSAAPVVEVRGLEKSFGAVRALRGVDFSVPAGSVLGFLGPNGAGKTTAIKILTGYLAADAGSARVCGLDVDRDPVAVRRHLGYLPENNPVYRDQDVLGFLRFAAAARGVPRAERRDAIDRAIARTGLEEVAWRPIAECSKGYRQRVGLAQALLHDPDLLVLDEPTNGLDPLQVVEIRELIRELGRTKTVILTSHVLSEIEALADRVVLLHRGRVVADGPLEAVGGAGVRARVGVRGSEEDLAAVLDAAGLRRVQGAPRPFGEPAYAACVAEADDSAALERVAGAAAERGVTLIELAPIAATLESLFREIGRAEGSEGVAVAGPEEARA